VPSNVDNLAMESSSALRTAFASDLSLLKVISAES